LKKKLESLYEVYVVEVPEVEISDADLANHIKNLNYLMSRIEKQMISSYENNEEIRNKLFKKLFIRTRAYLDYFNCKEIYLASLPSDSLRKELFEEFFKFFTCPPSESKLHDYAKRIKDLS
jgi:hypothetical protein